MPTDKYKQKLQEIVFKAIIAPLFIVIGAYIVGSFIDQVLKTELWAQRLLIAGSLFYYLKVRFIGLVKSIGEISLY